MRANVGLNQRQARFVSLVASGEHSVTEAHVLAGYGTKRDSANAHKLAKSLAEFISAERTRLGLPEPGAEAVSDFTDEETKRLVDDQRRLYRLALEADPPQVGAAQKCLRAIERLTKPKRAGGRPTTPETATAKPQQAERDSARVDALVAAFLTEDDLAEIEATWGNDAPPWGRVSRVSGEP